MEGALGISTGQGQGEAQIIKPFQSPVSPQQYGSVMAAQQKAQQDKKDKQAKALSSVADFQFKGLPQHAELFAKGYNDIIDYAVQNIDDPLIEFKLKQKMADLNTKANLSVDLKTNLQKQADAVQQGEGKNYFLGFDEAVKDVVSPVDYNTFLDTGKWGQALGDKANKINSVKTVPIYDVGKAKAALQNQVGGWAKDNLQGRTWETPDNVIDGVVEAELTGHPEAIVHFDKVMKNDPVGAKAAGNDPYKYGFNALKKDLQAKGFTEKGGTTVNVSTGSGATPSSSSVFNGNTIFGSGDNTFVQEGQPTASVPAKDAVTSPDPDTFDPTTFSKLKSGAVRAIKYGGMQVADVLDEDIKLPDGYIVPKGTPIPKGADIADIALGFLIGQGVLPDQNKDVYKKDPLYQAFVGKQPKKTVGLFAVGTGKEGDEEKSFYTPLYKAWGAMQGGLSKDDEAKLNAQGKTIYDEYIRLGGKPFEVVGVTTQKPTGGNKGGAARFSKNK